MAALDRALERRDGPTILAAHAYAGVAPDEGETVADVFYHDKPIRRCLNCGRMRMDRRIQSEKVDHTPLVTVPKPVIELILEPAAALAV